MIFLKIISEKIDTLTFLSGRVAMWGILLSCGVSVLNALSRKFLNMSSNAFLELQWYLYGAVFLIYAAETLRKQGHVRIDVISSRFSPDLRRWVEIAGLVGCLLPFSLISLYFSWEYFILSIDGKGGHGWSALFSSVGWEFSPNAGGLPTWPAKILMVIGFFLLSLQGVSEIFKGLAKVPPEPSEGH